MGIVFRARDRALARDVAIKTLPLVSADQSARLRREARAIATVTHLRGNNQLAVIANILTAEVPDISSFQPTVSSRLAAYFNDVLARDRRRRPKSAKGMRDRLQRLAALAA